MTRSEALHQLAATHGIAAGYLDDAGVRHETSDATREKLLTAMGLEVGGDLAALLAADAARAWRSLLPPVAVVRRGSVAAIDFTVSARRRRGVWRWTLEREDGAVEAGEFEPATIAPLEQGRLDDEDVFRLRLPLPACRALGYHRLQVAPVDLADGRGATMTLIVAPAACYLPGALAESLPNALPDSAPELQPRFQRGAAPDSKPGSQHREARRWGLAVQLYGLRSRRNWGIGDFGDLRQVVDLGASCGADLVGLNPLHALYPTDPGRDGPYSPNSRQFVNVAYLDVEAVSEVAESPAARARLADPAIQARLRRLRAAELVDYADSMALKLEILRLGYAHFREHHLAAGSGRARAWGRFRDEGGRPLAQFALFEALHAHFRAADPAVWGWPAWPAEFRSPESDAVQAFAAGHSSEIEFAIWLQWLADLQLGTAARQARLQGLAVGLYRDLAVGADAGGAETWLQQDLYATGVHIGAPPDDFSPRGQDWGLPPMLPQGLREAAYRPFVATVRANMRHAGALRIDHVMALARLFWVPAGEPAAAGAYVAYPLADLLAIVALESQRQQCLVIGEDLGTVPPELRAMLAADGVLTYRPFYFERRADGAFAPPQDCPAQALAVVSTHDLPTLAGFWQGRDIDERARLGLFASTAQHEAAVLVRAQDRARLLLALQHEALLPDGASLHPVAVPAITAELATAVHARLARTPAWLVAVQAEDIFGVVDQANLPGSTAPYPNWQRRLPVELESWSGDPRLQDLSEAMRRERLPVPTPGDATAVIPDATYRLQFNRDFGIAAATAVLPYLAELGISHCYASPYLKARPGSSHGYDIVDHNAFNPEIGSAEEFEAFAAALAQRGMGQILDIVPNHMGVMGADNAWWLDLLENGQASAYADYFDIDWQPPDPDLAGKVLLPLLGDHYGSVLGNGELQLRFDAERGEFNLHYFQHRLPIDPATYPIIVGHGFDQLAAALTGDPRLDELQGLLAAFGHLPARGEATARQVAERARDKELHKRHLAELCAASPLIARHLATNLVDLNGRVGEPASFDRLHRLIKAQAWRLAFWRVAADVINYRRFFDINELAALRMENPAVFTATHRLVLSLVARGWVQGLRIDHADGLYDPADYLRRLQQAAAGRRSPPAEQNPRTLPLYVVIEKILAEHERLPGDWPIHGATGYRFANLVNGLFVDAGAESRMSRIYAAFIGERIDFDQLVHDAKITIIRWSLQGEFTVLANQLWRIAAASRQTCDFTLNGLRDALAEVVACFPVYRSYFAGGLLSADDRRHIEWAIAVARRRSPASDASIFEFIGSALSGDLAAQRAAEKGVEKGTQYRNQVWRFAMKIQQFTAPVMAKGMEDTAFYRYHRLVSLNDVGGDPRRFGLSVAAFHAATRARAEHWPHALLAGSTHDSKRSADVRARIDVLSEIPAAWKLSLRRWSRINRSKKRLVDEQPAPSANDEYLLYQTLFGSWPLDGADAAAPSADELANYAARVTRYMLKAVREAKQHSSWINVNQDYEAALEAFIAALLAPGGRNLFLADFVAATRPLARFGLTNALAQNLLRLTSPGVPDLYQGDELWQFNLVDPDNRQAVDYERRRQLLDAVRTIRSGPPATWLDRVQPLVDALEDGRIKLYLIHCVLGWRRHWRELFRDGDYLPLAVAGGAADHVCAYARRHGERLAVVVVPRLLAKLQGEHTDATMAADWWSDTRVEVPEEWGGQTWFNVFTGETPATLAVGTLLAHFPVALLVNAPAAEAAAAR